MTEHPNARWFREMAQRTASNDPAGMEAMASALADDVEWHEIGEAEPIVGKQAVLRRWTSGGLAEVEFTSKPHAVVADDEHTIALMETTAKRGGRTFTYRTAEIMHVRDGKVHARWAFSDDTGRILDFFAGT